MSSTFFLGHFPEGGYLEGLPRCSPMEIPEGVSQEGLLDTIPEEYCMESRINAILREYKKFSEISTIPMKMMDAAPMECARFLIGVFFAMIAFREEVGVSNNTSLCEERCLWEHVYRILTTQDTVAFKQAFDFCKEIFNKMKFSALLGRNYSESIEFPFDMDNNCVLSLSLPQN